MSWFFFSISVCGRMFFIYFYFHNVLCCFLSIFFFTRVFSFCKWQGAAGGGGGGGPDDESFDDLEKYISGLGQFSLDEDVDAEDLLDPDVGSPKAAAAAPTKPAAATAGMVLTTFHSRPPPPLFFFHSLHLSMWFSFVCLIWVVFSSSSSLSFVVVF